MENRTCLAKYCLAYFKTNQDHTAENRSVTSADYSK